MKKHVFTVFSVISIVAVLLLTLAACGTFAVSDISVPVSSVVAYSEETPLPTLHTVISITVPPSEDSSLKVSPAVAPTPTPVPSTPPMEEPALETPSPEPKPLDGIIIGIDPGHQLIYDPAPEPVAPNSYETKQKVAGGCKGVRSGVYEYEVVLNVGLFLRDLLEEQGATVVMTHEVLDVNISNIERAEMFNEANVDLGIRLHCNKSDKPSTRGAFMLVPTENRTDSYDFNVRAAQLILDSYLTETGLSMRYKDGLTYRGDQTGFNWSTRPVITIEMGHLSNPEEDTLLSDSEFQKKMALGLCNGIIRVFSDQ